MSNDRKLIQRVLELSRRTSADLNELVAIIEQRGLNDIFLANDEIDFTDENMGELAQTIDMMNDTEKSCVRVLTEKMSVSRVDLSHLTDEEHWHLWFGYTKLLFELGYTVQDTYDAWREFYTL